MLKLALGVAKETGEKNLCLAGGVALNCVANGKLLREGHFERLWLQPAAGDAGGALGAALVAYHLFKSEPRALTEKQDAMRGGYLGPQFTQSDIEARLRRVGAVFEVLDEARLLERRACARARQGARLVPGPHGVRPARARRALDPRRCSLAEPAEDAQPQGQAARVVPAVRALGAGRGRPEVLRPRLRQPVHAARGRRRRAAAHRDDRGAAEALSGVDKLNVPRSSIPAVTHVDYSARVQTVHRETNARYHALDQKFKEKTGCPVIVNTSFNVPRRADRRHARGRVPLLLGHRDRAPCDRQLLPRQGAPELK